MSEVTLYTGDPDSAVNKAGYTDPDADSMCMVFGVAGSLLIALR